MLKTPFNLLLILFVTLFISFQSQSAVTKTQAKAVYLKLIKANHLKNPPNLHIVYLSKDDPYQDNAWSDEDGITLTNGIMKFLKNNDELAKVISHELGHHYLHHDVSSVDNEYDADTMGAGLMEGAHYNVCRGSQEFIRRNSQGGDDHPRDIDRYHRLGCR